MGVSKLKKEVPEEFAFHLADGRSVRSVPELVSILPGMPDEVFFHHVTGERNDFANWICDVYRAPSLSKKIAPVRDKKKLAKVLSDILKPKPSSKGRTARTPSKTPLAVQKAEKERDRKKSSKEVSQKKRNGKPAGSSSKRVGRKKMKIKGESKDIVNPDSLENVGRELDEMAASQKDMPEKLPEPDGYFDLKEHEHLPPLPEVPELPDADELHHDDDLGLPILPEIPDTAEKVEQQQKNSKGRKKKGLFGILFGKKEKSGDKPAEPSKIIDEHPGEDMPEIPDLPESPEKTGKEDEDLNMPPLPALPDGSGKAGKGDKKELPELPEIPGMKKSDQPAPELPLLPDDLKEETHSSNLPISGADQKKGESPPETDKKKRKGFFSMLFGKKKEKKEEKSAFREKESPDEKDVEVELAGLPPLPDKTGEDEEEEAEKKEETEDGLPEIPNDIFKTPSEPKLELADDLEENPLVKELEVEKGDKVKKIVDELNPPLTEEAELSSPANEKKGREEKSGLLSLLKGKKEKEEESSDAANKEEKQDGNPDSIPDEHMLPDLPELPPLPDNTKEEKGGEKENRDISLIEPDVSLEKTKKKGLLKRLFGNKEEEKKEEETPLEKGEVIIKDSTEPLIPPLKEKEEILGAMGNEGKSAEVKDMYDSYQREMEKIDNLRRQADHDIRERLRILREQESELEEQRRKLEKWQEELEQREEELKKQRPVIQARQISVKGHTLTPTELEKLNERKEKLNHEITDLLARKSELQVEIMQAKDKLADLEHEYEAIRKIIESNKKLLEKEEDRIIARVKELEKDKKLLSEKEDEIEKLVRKLEDDRAAFEKEQNRIRMDLQKREQRVREMEKAAKEKLADIVKKEKELAAREKELARKEEKIKKARELRASIEVLRKKEKELQKQYAALERKTSALEKKYLARKSIKEKEEELLARERELFERERQLKEFEKRLRYEEKQLEEMEFKQYLSENLSPAKYVEETEPSERFASEEAKSVQDLLLRAREALNNQDIDRAKSLFQQLRDAFEEVILPEAQKKELYYQILELKTDIDLALLKA